ncbi:MAG TPA: uroporphyrinogen decarboxylase family protein [Sedimentisphaerales bacterium]|jgi:uroporphyrinogen-III decarboxylase|nr:uroporphyrinogen decarboxylase family protein [Sedimentisphaerales bacterium]HNU31712.1 uroporphyrinogen decarboxylase family protein [Sedimentisphaerales bacterium]
MRIQSSPTAMTGRERVLRALNHQPTDRVPVDLGGTACSGAQVSVVARLRRALGLDKPGDRVRVCEPYQMLGEIAPDLRKVLGIDVVNLPNRKNMFGFENAGWKPWRTFDGTDVLVPAQFNTDPEPDGSILMYPEGDRSARPSARMPQGGYYFDSIIRQPPIDDAKLNLADNLEEFQPIGDDDLRHYERQANDLYDNTDLAIAAGFPGAAFGDIALVPGPWMKDPKGIRDIEEWYVSTLIRRDYIREVFARQAEIAIENLKRIHQAVGDKVHVVFMDGTDLASQNSLFCSPDTYRDLYLPHAKKVNDWVHAHTKWKTLKHCCGGCEPLIEGFIEAGYDVLNPVQTSAKGMDPKHLVDTFGDRIVFWGGGVDTQQTLPFGTPDEVRVQVAERVKILGARNGYVFNTIHNIQCNTPTENLLAMFQALGRNL